MTQTDYENKKGECWKECIREYGYLDPAHAFNLAFDRAYALGKKIGNSDFSDAEGEEMLTVSRKRVQEIYSDNCVEIHRECVSSSDKDCYQTVNEVLKTLFGSKCLLDDTKNDTKEPKPAEPKEYVNLSQYSANYYKMSDNSLKGCFLNRRRLNIAAQITASIYSNDKAASRFNSIEALVRKALDITDTLIAECERR